MNYTYDDFCQDAHDNHYCDEDTRIERLDVKLKLNEIRYWVGAIDEDLRNKGEVDISHIDWMLEELFHALDMPISKEQLNIVSKIQKQVA